MKKSTKIVLGSALGIAATVYGACTLIDELLLNKHMIPSPEFSAKVTGCDMTHLEEATNRAVAKIEELGKKISEDYAERYNTIN